MAHVIHLRCDRCGAPVDGREVWMRCDSCGATAGFNFTSWHDSPGFAEFQRSVMLDPQGYVARWNHHSAELERAVSLLRESPAQANAIATEQADFVLTNSSWMFPPHALEDRQTRAAYQRWIGFDLLHHRLPGRVRDLYDELNRATAAIGFGANENPLPAFQTMLDVLRRMLAARYELGSPPDPEGLSVEARLRLQAAQMVGAYLRLVSPELHLPLLQAIYGADSVSAQHVSSQDYSVYFDWECPRCGLFSPQAVGVDKMTCPGCYCVRLFDKSPQEWGAIAALCHGCGSRIEIAERQTLAACGYCTSQVKRYVRAGDAHRSLVAEMKAKYAAQHGYDLSEVDKESDGFGVTPGNRLARLRDGLVRIAQWYNKFLTPTRYLGFARASRPGDLEALLAETEAEVRKQGPPEGAELVRRAQSKLSEQTR